jgi:hypothetical protein
VKITKSTADAVIDALYPNREDLLLRFETVKAQANLADGERDKLRQFIQDKVAEGQYGRCILSFDQGAEQAYVNSDGKFILKHYLLTDVDRVAAGRQVLVMDGVVTLEAVLHKLQQGKDELTTWWNANTIGIGETQENRDTYSEKGSTKISIVTLPEKEESLS